MPAKSRVRRRFTGRAGKKTRTGMTKPKLKDFPKLKLKDIPKLKSRDFPKLKRRG